MKNILIIADDLTGACDTAAQFARPGQPVKVSADGKAADDTAGPAAYACAVNTSSRHDTPEDAGNKIRALTEAKPGRSWDMVYKKTDSVLRGNIGAELGALISSRPGASVVYAPAFPEAGRTVREGILYVNGEPVDRTAFAEDPLCPVTERSILTILKKQTDVRLIPVPVSGIRSKTAAFGKPGVIYVCDGETWEDLQLTAELCLACPKSLLFAGPAGFARYIAELSLESEQNTAEYSCPGPILCASGSLHPVSIGQSIAGFSAGFHAVYPESDISHTGSSDILLLPSPGMEVLENDPLEGLAAQGADLMRRGAYRSLFLFGGETACAVCRTLGIETMEISGEIEPGVNRGRTVYGGLPLELVLKSGGFGSPDLLCRLRKGVQV